MLPKYVAEFLPVEKKTIYYSDLPDELRDTLWNEFRNSVLPLRSKASHTHVPRNATREDQGEVNARALTKALATFS